jgi:uncharacterized caspase-like protein
MSTRSSPAASKRRDAADVAQALRKLRFDVVEGRDLDKHEMEDKIREFGRKVERADLALLFYAGRGMQVGARIISFRSMPSSSAPVATMTS